MHDAILVGIGTVLNDDPQLNGLIYSHSPLLYLIFCSSKAPSTQSS